MCRELGISEATLLHALLLGTASTSIETRLKKNVGFCPSRADSGLKTQRFPNFK